MTEEKQTEDKVTAEKQMLQLPLGSQIRVTTNLLVTERRTTNAWDPNMNRQDPSGMLTSVPASSLEGPKEEFTTHKTYQMVEGMFRGYADLGGVWGFVIRTERDNDYLIPMFAVSNIQLLESMEADLQILGGE